MKKMMKRTMVCCLVASICWTAFLMQDRRKLREGLIRFHVVAHSDRPEDQAIKYQVRDRVIQSMQSDLQKIADMDEAKEYLQEHLPKLQTLVDETLEELGFSGVALTDDLIMDAVSAYAADGKAAVMAIQAGADMIVSSDFEKEIAQVVLALENDELTVERIEQSVLRVLQWKLLLGVME